jgi:hypothetical protein
MSQHSGSNTRLLASLTARATDLLQEIQNFEAFLQKQKIQDSAVELRHFKKNVQTEIKTLARVCTPAGPHEPENQDGEREARNLHLLQSTNLTFYEAVWDVAMRSRGVVVLGKMVPRGSKSEANDYSDATQKKTISVDLITDDGLAWVKVSTIKKDRILFDIAKAGWEGYGQCANTEQSSLEHSFEKPDLRLCRLARDLHAASLQTRVSYRHPSVCLVLPEITKGESEDIDAVLQDIRAIGVTVECARRSKLVASERHSLIANPKGRFEMMLPSPPEPLTKILNIDSTVLISLISDISHCRPSALPDPQVISAEKRSFHKAILQQIAEEEASALLPTELYPALISRKLVCTVQAAARVNQIVDTMGSSTERVRASILFSRGKYAGLDEMKSRQELGRLSIHRVPDELSVAITQINFTPEEAFSKSQVEQLVFPASIVMRAAYSMNWSTTNESVLLYGWCENIATVTSNQIVAGRLVQAINKALDNKEREAAIAEGVVNGRQEVFRGPRIRIIRTARSLIGRNKNSEKSLDS